MSLYVRGEKTILNMVQKTVFSYPHWPLFIRTTFLKANFTTEGKGDFRASVAREKKSKKEEGVCGHKGSTLLPPPSVGAGVLFRRRKRMEGQDSRQLPRERERAHCRLEHTPIVAPSHSVSLKRAQDATLPKWGPTRPKERGRRRQRRATLPNLAPPSSFLSHLPLRKMGEGQKLLGRFF